MLVDAAIDSIKHHYVDCNRLHYYDHRVAAELCSYRLYQSRMAMLIIMPLSVSVKSSAPPHHTQTRTHSLPPQQSAAGILLCTLLTVLVD